MVQVERVLFAVVMAAMSASVGCSRCQDQSTERLSASGGVDITVPARPPDWRGDVLSPTTVHVTQGSRITLAASGRWSVGVGVVGPEGKEEWCECVVAEQVGSGSRGPLGALVGRIGRDGAPFLVGTRAEIRSDRDGILYLGANDNMGPCDGAARGSCYRDNQGTVDVHVVVRAEPRRG